MGGNIYSGIKLNAVPSYVPNKVDICGEKLLGDVYIKNEPLDGVSWKTKDSKNPDEFLQHVKAEEISSKSLCSDGGDALTTMQYHILGRTRSKHAEVVARKRANESPSKRLERLRKNAERAAFKRSIESAEEAFIRRQRNAQRNSVRRSLETEEEKEKRRKLNAERQAKKRKNETPEQRDLRRIKDLLRARRRRLLETEEQAQTRKISDAARAKARRQNETEEEKNIRRLNDIIRITRRRGNETFKDRQDRLRKNRDYSAKKRYIHKLEYELNNSKNSDADMSMSMRNCEEDISCMNVNAKTHEYHHYIGSMLHNKEENNIYQLDRIDKKFFPLTNTFNEFNIHTPDMEQISSVDDNSVNVLSKDSNQSPPDEISAETMLVLL
ncbi:hypothetical protein WA026_007399 [Henosepilachna vigintioctopunctata]|uniref:Uncharacterized protein n=1 Tax=Henosepilachna vigintioctopunctata TaxID=420089 RepID=A0AAW1UP25_9CUCU